MKDKKGNTILIIIMIISILVVFGAGIYVFLNEFISIERTPTTDNIEEEQNDNDDNNKKNNDIEVYIDKYVELKEENVTFEVDKRVKLNFTVADYFYTKDGYSYVMELIMDGKVIETGIFDDNAVIRSDALAGTFRVIKINEIYIFIASQGAQFNGNYILIIDEEGNKVKTFNDVGLTIDLDNNKMELSRCIREEVNEDCLSITYEFKNKDIKIIKSTDITEDKAIELLKYFGKEKLGLTSSIDEYQFVVLKEEIYEDETYYKIAVGNDVETIKFMVAKNGFTIFKLAPQED